MKKLLLMAMTTFTLSCDTDDKPEENELKGKWNWVSTCGGFIPGNCFYPDQTNFKSIEFTGNTYIERNGTLDATELHYKVINKHIAENHITISFEIKLANGNTLRLRTGTNTLGIENGSTWESYERSFSR